LKSFSSIFVISSSMYGNGFVIYFSPQQRVSNKTSMIAYFSINISSVSFYILLGIRQAYVKLTPWGGACQ
jgi:hypothetical protein